MADRITAADLEGWFDEVVHPSGRVRPDHDFFARLADSIALLRENDWSDPMAKKAGELAVSVHAAARNLHAAIAEWEQLTIATNEHYPRHPFRRAARILERFKIAAWPATPSTVPRGKPRSGWHRGARKLAQLIQNGLRDAGYLGRLGMADEQSVVAVMGAVMMKRVYGVHVQASGFAAAMRGRDRSRGESPLGNAAVPIQPE